MPETAVPSEVYNFLLSHFDSVGAIEAFLLLRRNQDRTWTSAEVSKRLFISEIDAHELLGQLCEDGLISCDSAHFRYLPAEPGMEDLLQRVTDAYQSQLVAVTQVIHSKPRRIREFANAFKLRKDRG